MMRHHAIGIALAAVLLAAAPPKALAAPGGPGGMECTVVLSDSSPLPFEPMGALIRLHNGGRAPVEFTHPSGGLWIRRVNAPATEWHAYGVLSLRGELPPVPRREALPPGGTFTEPVPLDYNEGWRHEFPEPGTYEVEARKDRWESRPVRVHVRMPEGADAQAYEWLQKQDPRLGALLGERDWQVVPDVYVTPLQQLVERFPTSRYADLARVGLAFAWMIGVEHYPNGGRTREQSLFRAEELLSAVAARPSPVTARAYYYLGILAAKRGQPSRARERYQTALASKPDPYIEYLAGEALSGPPKTVLLP